jgi:hypothetical protein
VLVPKLDARTDVAHLFETDRARLAKALKAALPKLKPAGVVWVSWPKKASKVPTDITEDTIREIALPMGLVDVKVCAVDGRVVRIEARDPQGIAEAGEVIAIRRVAAAEDGVRQGLCDLLVDAVDGGASIGFLRAAGAEQGARVLERTSSARYRAG